jgi:hypothetical protein
MMCFHGATGWGVARSHGPIDVSQGWRGPRDARPGRSADEVQTIAAGSLVQVRSR